jgi:exonuclease SbcD
MRQIRGTYDELTARSFYLGTAVDDYLHITLTDEEDVPEAVSRLRVIYPNLMKLTYDNTRTRTASVIEGAVDIQKKSKLQLFEELYELQNGQPMTDVQKEYMQGLIESIWEGEK